MQDNQPLLTFPCAFPIKVMGVHSAGFEAEMVSIARKHAPNLEDTAVVSRPSKTGKYLALTLTIQAESQMQLDAIYCELSAHKDVRMTL